ncbi:DUF4007 family protein [Dyadobacter sp. CY107]|uniref:DUF4007 family protein n=1 Tax=Dyadobacter fanqingshengii TaxID=2906443 RepID=UPI001F2C5DAA|nr:DUF4007 family protein [Dyadobacter fanqingshengii]MCF2503764.1 DUF4007 family protein [Dyadobacter fanqingshengii]
MQYLKEYQGFTVDLFDISRLFQMIGSGKTDKSIQLSETGFGSNKIRAIKEYLLDFDLIGNKSVLTPLGQLLFKSDARFREPFTKWLLIYHWSSKKNNPYLNFLVNNGIGISSEDKMINKFRSWAAKNEVKTDYGGNMLTGMIRNTENSFTNPNAFLDLNFFVKDSGVVGRGEPYQVEPLLNAYILYHNRNRRMSTGFSELLREENNFAKFFNLDATKLDKRIVELNNLGFTRLIQYADLHFIEYTYNGDTLSLIQKYYDEN